MSDDLHDFTGFQERLRRAVETKMASDDPVRIADDAMQELKSHPLANYIRVHEIFTKHLDIARRKKKARS